MNSTTTGYSPSVPETNGHSTWIPEPGVEIWRVTLPLVNHTGATTKIERVYPSPESEETNGVR